MMRLLHTFIISQCIAFHQSAAALIANALRRFPQEQDWL